MRRSLNTLIVFSVLLLTIVFAFQAPSCQASEMKGGEKQDNLLVNWTVETVDADVDVGIVSAIVLDSQDIPYILYRDSRYNRIKQAEKVDDQWNLEVIHAQASLVHISPLDIDSRDRLHIAFNRMFGIYSNYGIRENESWQFQGISNNHVLYSIAADSLNRPHIGATLHFNVYHIFHDGSEWRFEEVEKKGDTTLFSEVSIAVDPKSRIHLSYARDPDDKALRYALWDGNKWNLETVDYIDSPSSIAVTSDGDPHILYYGPQSCACLRHAFKEGNSWNIENLPFASSMGSITIDSLDRPHISFGSNATLGYAFRDGSSWKVDSVEGAWSADSASIAMDSLGYPHISYYNSASNNLMYATVSRPAMSVSVDIDPDALNLQSRGRWITGYIELGEGYDVKQINASTILLNDTVHPVLDMKYGFVGDESSYIVDHDGDGILERMVKFDRSEVEKLLSPGDPVSLAITGQLYDGTKFEGSDKIKVINPAHLIQSRFSYTSRPRDNENLVRSDDARNVVVGRLSHSAQVLDSFKTYPSRLFGRA